MRYTRRQFSVYFEKTFFSCACCGIIWYRPMRVSFTKYFVRFNKSIFFAVQTNVRTNNNKKRANKKLWWNKSKKSVYGCKNVFGKHFYSQLIHIEYVWDWEWLSIDVKGQVAVHIFFSTSVGSVCALASVPFHLSIWTSMVWILNVFKPKCKHKIK